MPSEEELKRTFSLFDSDNSGKISCDELGTVLRSFGHMPTQKELKKMIQEVDSSGSGTVEYDEFVKLLKAREQEQHDPEAQLKTAFKVFDRDGSGFIDVSELKNLLISRGDTLTEAQVTDMFNKADINEDGKVDYNEFVKVMLA